MLQKETIESFLDQLAANSATPGGGGVAALNGAMGASLVSMVCRLTIGKKKYANVEAEMKNVLQDAETLRTQLIALINEDISAFNQVMAAYGMPRENDADKKARSIAIQNALKDATIVPLETTRACAAVIALSKIAAKKGNTNAASDAGSAAQSALAGLRSAALNVEINLGSIKDEQFVAEKQADLAQIMDGQNEIVAEIYRHVQSNF